MPNARLILLRHGESVWNKEERFTGWMNADLSAKGIQDAHIAGRVLCEKKISIDCAFTSFLRRAQITLDCVLKELHNCNAVPVRVLKSWRLNERHYGALQGLTKQDAVQQFGAEQVHQWRRSYNAAPPPLSLDDPRHPIHDPLYKHIDSRELPSTESLHDAYLRFLPVWQKEISQHLTQGHTVLIVAHGNSLRALVKYLEHLSDDAIIDVEIPNGNPLVYELDAQCDVEKKYCLQTSA